MTVRSLTYCETNRGNFKIQQAQFSTVIDSNDVSIEKVIEILSDFGKNSWLEIVDTRNGQLSKNTFDLVMQDCFLE